MRSIGTAVAFSDSSGSLSTGHLIGKDEIHLDKKLGEGAFGAVYLGKCRGASVAVKVPSTDIEEDQLLEFQREVNTMSSISHPRLAMMLGAYIPPAGSKESVMIVLELLAGDMETILHRDQKLKRLTLFQRMEWAMQAAEGMAWLHGAGLIHRDMKPSNLLYSASSRSVKVADFGLAGLLGKGEVLEDGQMVGNPRFWAPEIIDRKPWSKKSDVYALGITMVTFVTREDVFLDYWTGSSLRLEFLSDLLEHDLRPELPKSAYKCPPVLKSLLERCFHKDPEKRPSCIEIADTFEREVLIHCALPDPVLRQVWQMFPNKQPGLLREVQWEVMGEVIKKMVAQAKANEPTWNEVEVLMTIYKLFRNEWDPFGEEICSIQHVGRVGGFFPKFGVLGDGKWIRTVFSMIREHPWFWCDSSRTEAEQYLSRSPAGTFVVRFANEASFRMSIRTDTETLHFKIRHAYQGETFSVKGIEGLENIKSLPEVTTAVAASLKLTPRNPSYSPFSHIFKN